MSTSSVAVSSANPPVRHFTEQPSGLRWMHGPASRWVEGAGFLDRSALDLFLERCRANANATEDLLVDLREMTGYEQGCARRAYDWLRSAHRWGVRRVAFVSSSSVLRTAVRAIAGRTAVEVAIFDHPAAATRWLGEAPAPGEIGPARGPREPALGRDSGRPRLS